MKTIITAFAFVAVAAGVFAYTRPHSGVPSDLRDAVADSALNALQGEAGEPAAGVSVPEAVPAKPAKTAVRAPAGVLIKGLVLPEISDDKRHVDKSAGFSAPDRELSNALSGLKGATPYEKVKELFESARPATKEDLAGWRVGRVFMVDGTIQGAMLTMVQDPVDLGPLFERGFVLFAFINPAPAKFDNMSINEWRYIKRRIAESDGYWRIAFPEAIAALNGYTAADAVLEERKMGGYIVERWRAKEGDVYSYYFKDVTPPKLDIEESGPFLF